MQIFSRSILLLSRRPRVASSTASAPLLALHQHRLSFPSRTPLSSVASAPPHWWRPTFARRDAPLMAASSSPNRPIHPVSLFADGSRSMSNSSGVKGEELVKQGRRSPFPYADKDIYSTNSITIAPGEHFAITQGDACPAIDKDDLRRATVDPIFGEKDVRGATDVTGVEENASRETEDVIALYGDVCPGDREDDASRATEVADDEEYAKRADKDISISCYGDDCPDDGVRAASILENSSHRDGSLYEGTREWQIEYRVADRNETRLEPMSLSDRKDCFMDRGICLAHAPGRMLQIFSLKLAKTPVGCDSVELYGYLAVRDMLDPSLNYVINLSRDDPIVIEKGSLIQMTGPKRGIDLYGTVLIEYDMRIKTGEHKEHDLQLIDGVSTIDDMNTAHCHLFTSRIHGDSGAVDMTASRFDHAVEATVEVAVSEVKSGFILSLSSFISGLHEEIQLFHGAIAESRGLRRSVVALVMDSWMHLKFKVGSGSNRYTEHCCSFKADQHGFASEQIKTEFASISLKVTWSILAYY